MHLPLRPLRDRALQACRYLAIALKISRPCLDEGATQTGVELSAERFEARASRHFRIDASEEVRECIADWLVPLEIGWID